VHDVALGGEHESARGLAQDAHDLGPGPRPEPAEQVLEAAAVHELHGQPVAAGVLADVVDVDDVGVVERGGGARFFLELSDERAVVGQLAGEDLERDAALQALLHRQVDLAHGAASDGALDAEAREAFVGRLVEVDDAQVRLAHAQVVAGEQQLALDARVVHERPGLRPQVAQGPAAALGASDHAVARVDGGVVERQVGGGVGADHELARLGHAADLAGVGDLQGQERLARHGAGSPALRPRKRAVPTRTR